MIPISPPPAGERRTLSSLRGALQFLIFIGYSYLAVLIGGQGAEWISANAGIVDVYLR